MVHRLLHRWHQTGIIFCFNSTCFFKHLLHQLRWKKMTIKESCRPFFTQRSLTTHKLNKEQLVNTREREREWKWRRKERSTIRSLGLKAKGSVDGSMPAVKLSKTTIRTHNFSKLVWLTLKPPNLLAYVRTYFVRLRLTKPITSVIKQLTG